MDESRLSSLVKEFLLERGCSFEENGSILYIDSLDYLALILYVEQIFKVQIDSRCFYESEITEHETLEILCQRLIQAQRVI